MHGDYRAASNVELVLTITRLFSGNCDFSQSLHSLSVLNDQIRTFEILIADFDGCTPADPGRNSICALPFAISMTALRVGMQ